MKELKTRRRFNLLDAALILLVLMILVGVWQRQNLQRIFTVDEVLEEYTVSFEIKQVRSTTVAYLSTGTAFYLEKDGERVTLGTLSAQVASSAATVELRDKDGNPVSAVYPEDDYEYLWDVSGTLRCEGVERNGSFLVGGKLYLAYNKTVQVRTEMTDLDIRITGISKVG